MRKVFICFIYFTILINCINHLYPITIGFAGDVMLGRGVNEVLQTKPCEYIWGSVLPLLQSTTFNIINLETALTKSMNKVPKVFNYKSDPNNAACLTVANIKIVNLANNHSLDFNVQGLKETLETLKKNNIFFVGAGINKEEAEKPVVISIENLTIGIIGCTDNEPSWAATQNKPGVNYISLENVQALKQQIKNLKSKVDFIIVTIHWGPNWPLEPSEQMKSFAHEIINAGADIIHGHSAHITLGIEMYKERLIIYSAGDFIDDYAIDPVRRNDYSFFYKVSLNNNQIQKIQLIPVLLTYAQVNKAPTSDASIILAKVRAQSKKLGIELNQQGIWERSPSTIQK